MRHFREGKLSPNTVYVMDPVCESRRQTSKDSFVIEYDALKLLDSLTKRAMHNAFGNLPLVYDSSKFLLTNPTKALLDSILATFRTHKYRDFKIGRKFTIPSSCEYVLVPYVIWIRTTDDFEQEKCGRDGYKIYVDNVCTWTEADMYLFIFDRRTAELIYFNQRKWASEGVILPYYDRVDRSFRVVTGPLLENLSI